MKRLFWVLLVLTPASLWAQEESTETIVLSYGSHFLWERFELTPTFASSRSKSTDPSFFMGASFRYHWNDTLGLGASFSHRLSLEEEPFARLVSQNPRTTLDVHAEWVFATVKSMFMQKKPFSYELYATGGAGFFIGELGVTDAGLFPTTGAGGRFQIGDMFSLQLEWKGYHAEIKGKAQELWSMWGAGFSFYLPLRPARFCVTTLPDGKKVYPPHTNK